MTKFGLKLAQKRVPRCPHGRPPPVQGNVPKGDACPVRGDHAQRCVSASLTRAPTFSMWTLCSPLAPWLSPSLSRLSPSLCWLLLARSLWPWPLLAERKLVTLLRRSHFVPTKCGITFSNSWHTSSASSLAPTIIGGRYPHGCRCSRPGRLGPPQGELRPSMRACWSRQAAAPLPWPMPLLEHGQPRRCCCWPATLMAPVDTSNAT
jgi:hypothetical protein